MKILTVNLLFSSLVFWLAAQIYALPKRHQQRPQTVPLSILLQRSFRLPGLILLAQGPPMPATPL